MRFARLRQLLLTMIGLLPTVFPAGLAGQASPTRSGPATVATATIAGQIVDETATPIEGAVIVVSGSAASTRSGPTGAFRLSGVTPGKAAIEVSRDGYSTLAFDFDIAAGVTVSLKLTLATLPPPVPQDSAARADSVVATDTAADGRGAVAGKVTMQGRIIDSAGKPLFGAVIEEASSSLRTMSDSSGRFRLIGMAPGLAFVRARKIGYLAEYFPLTGVAGRTITATITLRPAGQQLAKVTVADRDLSRNEKMRGFYERAGKGTGIFIERDEIVRRNATQLSDMLRGRNGINVYSSGGNGTVLAGRGLRMAGGQGGPGICPLALILDGVYIKLQDGLTVDRVVNVQDVRAIEVYTTGPQVPAELANGQTDCGAVVVWTR